MNERMTEEQMDETVIVIMLKDKSTGILDRELGSYSIFEHENLIVNAFAVFDNGALLVKMKLSCERDVSDEEFDAVYDNYDSAVFDNIAESVTEVEDCFNPTWEFTFSFSENEQAMTETINKILKLHKEELEAVYEVIERG